MNSQLLTSISQYNNDEPKEVLAQKRFYEKIHEKAFYHHSVKKIDDTAENFLNDNDDIFLLFDKTKINFLNITFQKNKYIEQAVLSNYYLISSQLPELNNDWLAGEPTKQDIILNLFNRIQDLYENYNITEYQPVSKYIYQIQDKPLEELQTYYFEMLTNKERFYLRAVKMKYNNFLSGNYDVIANNDNTLNIIEHNCPDFNFISSLATNIVQTREAIFDPLQPIENKIHVFNTFLDNLNKTINKSPIKDTINTEITVQQMVENAHNLYKQISIRGSAYDKYFSSYTIKKHVDELTNIPKFKEHDTFYLVFEKKTNRHGNHHNCNGQHLKINEQYKPTATDKKVLEKIITELNHFPYDFKFGFATIYGYPPECYQSIANFCYDLENQNCNDLLGYNKYIKMDWRAVKITYGDYIAGNYKVVLDSNLNRTIITNNKKLKDLPSKLAVAVEECKNFMSNDISKTDDKGLKTESTVVNNDTPIEDINKDMEYKIRILQDLFIPIDIQDKVCTIEDFCLSANLILGDTFLKSAASFKKMSS
jgi:hypothetical protein